MHRLEIESMIIVPDELEVRPESICGTVSPAISNADYVHSKSDAPLGTNSQCLRLVFAFRTFDTTHELPVSSFLVDRKNRVDDSK